MVDFRFVGGALGYISYDAIRYIEKLPSQKPDDLQFPDVEMGIFEDGIVFDHTINQAYYYFRGENRLKEIQELLNEPAAEEEPFTYTQPTVNIAKEDFEKAVEKAKAVRYCGRHIPGCPLQTLPIPIHRQPPNLLQKPTPNQPLTLHVLLQIRQTPNRRRQPRNARPHRQPKSNNFSNCRHNTRPPQTPKKTCALAKNCF